MSETFGGLGRPDRAGRPVQELIMAETERESGGEGELRPRTADVSVWSWLRASFI
jgi:hypothetical protein